MFARRKVKIAMPLLLAALGLVFAAAVPIVTARATTLLASSADQRIRLTSAPTRVAIAPTRQAAGAQPLEVAGGQPVFLVLEGLSATLAPGTSYNIFLGPAAAANPARDDPGYAGTLDFFDISALSPAEARTISFDVTSVLERLRRNGEIKDPLAVTFVPEGPPRANSEPAVQRLSLIQP